MRVVVHAVMQHPLYGKAVNNVRSALVGALEHNISHRALVVFDTQSGLSSLLADAYREALPGAEHIDFHATTPDVVRASIDVLSPKDLVVLVQSSSFRLNEFRFRLELFNRGLAVIEHPHLGRMPEHEYETYLDALAYDPPYYRGVGKRLKARIDAASRIVVTSRDGSELVYEGAFEDAKLNIGDYTGMKNIGGQFPIGEVFTEPKDIFSVSGFVQIYAFGDADFCVVVPEKPFLVHIEKGILTESHDAPPAFRAVLDQIQADEEVWVRELGFGMNRALTRHQMLTDIGSYERMCGIHLSLGQKHTIYAKPGMPKRSSKYHVDVFVDVASATIDGEVVFQDGQYLV